MVKNTTKFQVLRVSYKFLYSLQLDNYSANLRYKVVTKAFTLYRICNVSWWSSYQAEDCKVIYMKL